jgi:hypothetical protein
VGNNKVQDCIFLLHTIFRIGKPCGYFYISLISIYFARELFAVREIQDLSEFSRQTGQWLLFSWHRPILMTFIEIFLLIALSRCVIPQNKFITFEK